MLSQSSRCYAFGCAPSTFKGRRKNRIAVPKNRERIATTNSDYQKKMQKKACEIYLLSAQSFRSREIV